MWFTSSPKTNDTDPVHYYAYDRKTKKAPLLFTSRKGLENVKWAEMKPIKFKARDGLTIHAYLTTPLGIRQKNLPMAVKVHGANALTTA